jgi:hypothetical protein
MRLSQEHLEIKRLSSHLESLSPPAHVILLYGPAHELEPLKRELRTREYPLLTMPSTRTLNTATPLKGEEPGCWALRCLDAGEFSDPGKIIRTERRIQERRPVDRVMCAYPLGRLIGLGEDHCVTILSLHDSILFTRFTKGGLVFLESAEEALSSALGPRGAEMIHNYLEERGIERSCVTLQFERCLEALRALLGTGADPLARLTYQTLFRKLRSSPEAFEDGS